jgi:hypothetical protein
MADKSDINLTRYPHLGTVWYSPDLRTSEDKNKSEEKSPLDPPARLSQATCLIQKPTHSLLKLHVFKHEFQDFNIILMIILQNNLSNPIPEFLR